MNIDDDDDRENCTIEKSNIFLRLNIGKNYLIVFALKLSPINVTFDGNLLVNQFV